MTVATLLRAAGRRAGSGRGRPALCVVGPFPPPVDGTTVAIERLGRSRLVGERFDVTRVDTSRGELPTDAKIGRFEVGKAARDLLDLARLVGVIARRRPDVVYVSIAQTPLGYLRDGAKIALASALGRRCVLHLHGGSFRALYDGAGPLYRRWIRLTLRRADRVIVLAPSLGALFEGLVDRARIRVVPNCVDDELFLSPRELEEKAARAAAGGEAQALFMSNFLESKGYRDVLEAARLLRERGEAVRFVFAGSWPDAADEERTRAVVSRHGLENVRFAGFVRGGEKRALLLESDLFVLPSYSREGQPISLLEAMAAGLPAVVTPAGGVPDVVAEGETGVFVPQGAPAALAEAIARLAGDGALRERMTRACARAAAERYGGRRYEEALLAVFDEVAGPGGTAR